jgi:hypothetical protein
MPEREKSKLPDWDALEKQGKAATEAARTASQTPSVEGGTPSALADTMNDASLAFLDKASLGLLPAARAGIEKLTGYQGKGIRDMQVEAEQRSPIASTIGGGAGMALPIGGALRLAQGLKAIPLVGGAVQGAAAVGGENIADQAVRTQTEDRPFSGTEAAGAAALGAVNPFNLASGGLKLAAGPIARRTLGPIWDMVRRSLPEAAGGAEKTLGMKFGEVAEGVTPPKRTGLGTIERPRAGPPEPQAPAPENLGAYAPDDPLGEVARMAREQARIRRISDPNWAPDPGPLDPARILKQQAPPPPPPVAPPEGLLQRSSNIADTLAGTWRHTVPALEESGVRVGSEEKKKARDRMRAIRR